MIATLRTRIRRLTQGSAACLLGGCLAASAVAQMPPQRFAAPQGFAAPQRFAAPQGYAVQQAAMPAPRQAAPPAMRPVLQAHTILGADVRALERHLSEQFAAWSDLGLVSDPQSNRLFVTGMPQTQEQIHKYLLEQKLIAPPSGVQLAAATEAVPLPAPQAAAPQRLVTQSWQLKNLNWHDFEQSLLRTWGTRLEASQNSDGDMATFRFPARPAGATSFMVDHRNNLVTITSPATTARSWLRMAQIIDSRPQTGDEYTSVVPLDKSDPQLVLKTIDLIRRAGQNKPPVSRRSSNGAGRKQHIGQFASMLFQQPDGGQPGGAQPGGFIPGEGGAPPDAMQVAPTPGDGGALAAVARLAGNVRIEILDDIVIVVGRKEDVDRVMAIIEQIEQQSIEFRPEVEIYHLKNVDGQQLNLLIQQVYASVFTRQGPVTIVPLVDPNALLLIGRKENIPGVVELIAKLDQRTPSSSQFKVFHLKYMSCIDAERTVKNFFTAQPLVINQPRAGTGMFVMVIAEFRANALIVQAAPRDMAEVERLIASLDIENTEAKAEVRVFKLRNTLADTLAPVLLEAITGAGLQQQAVQQAPAGGAAGQTSPATANQVATSMQFQIQTPNGPDMLKSGVLRTMRITADPGSNSIIVVGPESGMPLMEAIIAKLDGLPPTEATLKVFSITNGDATAISTMLQTLFGQTQQQNAAQGLNQAPTSAGESSLVPLRFSVDQRTNTIIVTGNPGDLEVVRLIILRLDLPGQTDRITTVIRLHNAPAADLGTALTSLLTQQRTLNQAAPELITPYQQIEREVLIQPEPITNSLIISATPRYFERILLIVKELDKRPPMVAIQVVIAEVTLTDNEQFGVEWGLQDSLLFDRGIPTAAAGALTPGFPFNNVTSPLGNQNSPASLATRNNVAGQALSNLAMGRVDPTLGFGGLVLSASSDSVNVVLRALESSSRLQVISRPQVQTLDNQLAYVNVGALVPRITGVTQSTVGVANPQLTDISVGIILEVTPRTSPDGTIVMQVNATKSAVGPDATGIPVFTDANGNVVRSPQIPLTTAQTTVSARTGQTVILGGLITKSQTESTRRIPYMADIPVLGRLFRFDTVLTQRTELLIILTPYIMRTEEQNEWLNARESQRMSWCLADLVNIHGPVGLSGNPAYNAPASGVIYPDIDPNGPPPPLPNMMPPSPSTLDPMLAPPGTTSPLTPIPPYAPPGTPPPPAPMLNPPPGTPTRPQSTGSNVPQSQGLPPSVLQPTAGDRQAGYNSPPPGSGPPPAPPPGHQPPNELRSLTPEILQPAVPPVGTQSAYRPWPQQPPPQVPPGMATPANYQVPANR